MKKWLLAASLSLIMTKSLQAVDKIAIVNTDNLLQEIAQRTGVSTLLESEFRDRANELQSMEGSLQSKMQYLQRDGSTMKNTDRSQLEKDFISERQIFSQKVQAFEQDRQRRSNEERAKLIARIYSAVQSVVDEQNIDLVFDANAVVFNTRDIKDITSDVLKQVR